MASRSQQSRATGFFGAGGDLKRFFEDFAFHRLLAKQTLQLFDLVLQGSIFGGRNDVILRCGGRQSP
jgi:hypothetical protein